MDSKNDSIKKQKKKRTVDGSLLVAPTEFPTSARCLEEKPPPSNHTKQEAKQLALAPSVYRNDEEAPRLDSSTVQTGQPEHQRPHPGAEHVSGPLVSSSRASSVVRDNFIDDADDDGEAAINIPPSSSLAEAEPVGAETVVYASTVQSYDKLKRRTIYLVIGVALLTAIVVGVVVGTATRPNGDDPPCEAMEREDMTARMECQCFGEIELEEDEEGARIDAWAAAKESVRLAHNFTTNEAFMNASITDCSVENMALSTMVEVTGTDDVNSVFSNVGDFYAVVTFYIAFQGDDWFRNDNWLTSSSSEQPQPACTAWFGLECTISGRVSGFAMNNNNLRGNFSTAGITWPLRLNEIMLRDNPGMIGSLSVDIFLLESLKRLDLRNNGLGGQLSLFSTSIQSGIESGDIPVDLSNVDFGILFFDVSNNSLTGTLPASAGLLTRLRNLHIDQNQLTGSMPSTLALMTSLEEFSASSNEINGTLPSDLTELSYLEVFDVRNNSLSGTIPASFGALARLSFLDLSWNARLSGTVPAPLRECTVNRFIDTVLLDCDRFDDEALCRDTDDGDCCSCSSNFQSFGPKERRLAENSK